MHRSWPPFLIHRSFTYDEEMPATMMPIIILLVIKQAISFLACFTLNPFKKAYDDACIQDAFVE